MRHQLVVHIVVLYWLVDHPLRHKHEWPQRPGRHTCCLCRQVQEFQIFIRSTLLVLKDSVLENIIIGISTRGGQGRNWLLSKSTHFEYTLLQIASNWSQPLKHEENKCIFLLPTSKDIFLLLERYFLYKNILKQQFLSSF